VGSQGWVGRKHQEEKKQPKKKKKKTTPPSRKTSLNRPKKKETAIRGRRGRKGSKIRRKKIEQVSRNGSVGRARKKNRKIRFSAEKFGKGLTATLAERNYQIKGGGELPKIRETRRGSEFSKGEGGGEEDHRRKEPI